MKALSIDGNVFKFPCGKVKGETKAFRDDQFPYQLQLMNFDVYNSIEYQWLKANNIHTFRKLVPIQIQSAQAGDNNIQIQKIFRGIVHLKTKTAFAKGGELACVQIF